MAEHSPVIGALFQAVDAHRVLWASLVDELIARGLIDHAELAAKISQFINTEGNRRGPVFEAITQSAMRDLALIEYPSLEDAPEWVQKMCRGEIAVRHHRTIAEAGDGAVILQTDGR